MITLQHYLVVSAALFSLGILTALTRRNAVHVLMGLELILNSANINLVAFSRFGPGMASVASGPGRIVDIAGHVFATFVILIAAAEVAVALAIVLTLYRLRRSPNIDEADILKG
jgi:NADH:ubiquinone oxidoreductase subunit K